METSVWIAQITDDSVREIAKRTGISERTLHHQITNSKISLENIIKISVAYSHHPISSLIEWGFIGEEWASIPDVESALRLASEDQLADEVLRRMLRGVETDALTVPVDELAARRQKGPAHDGTVTEWDDTQPHAADSSEEEGGSPDDYIP